MEFRTRGRAKRKKAPNGQKIAGKLVARLSQDEFREAAQLDAKTVENLRKIAGGKANRNAMAMVGAAQFLASYAYSKPKQEIEVSGSLGDRMRELEAAERARIEAQTADADKPEPEPEVES
jgi:hypothetical protein